MIKQNGWWDGNKYVEQSKEGKEWKIRRNDEKRTESTENGEE